MSTISKIATTFGIFDEYPKDVFLVVLERCSYAAMTSLAETNEAMKSVIRAEMSRKAFVSKWIMKQADPEQAHDCYFGAGLLIASVFGAADEGLTIMETLLEAGFAASKNFEGAGLMLTAFLNSQRVFDKQLVVKAFNIGWSLGDGFLDGALKSVLTHLETIDTVENLPDELFEEMEMDETEKEHYEKSLKEVYLVNCHVTRLLFFPTSPQVRRLIVTELYRRTVLAASDDVEQLAALLHVLLSPGDSDAEQVDCEFFKTQNVKTEDGRIALKSLAAFWKGVMEEVAGSEMSLLSGAFFRIPSATVQAVLLSLEPSLIRFYLHDVAKLLPSADFVLSSALKRMHKVLDEDVNEEYKLAEFKAVIDGVGELSEEQQEVLNELVDEVAMLAEDGGCSEEDNPFLAAFLELQE